MNRSRRKTLGQHFLVDRRAIARTTAALELRPRDTVLEIGPGRGALTASLIEQVGRLAAVEFDRGLAAALRRRFDSSALVVIDGDILTTDLGAVATALDRAPDTELVVAGNLPYSISQPIVQKLIRDRLHIDRAVLMFQREVAARLVATPGSRDYGPITVLSGLAYEIHKLFDLPPKAFRPAPEVHSSVTHWQRRPQSALTAEIEPALRACLGVAFRQRRRTLRNNVRAAIGSDAATDTLLADAGVDGAARAEAIAPDGFLALARVWRTTLV
jgi:16S rRNA (adenine1518-N6/adenine1519-N6)-dimethyltransferase